MLSKTSKQTNRLKLSEFKLNTLLEITNAINNNFSSEQLFMLLKFILQNQLNIGKAIIFINTQHSWECVMEYGVSEHEKEIDIDDRLAHLIEITVVDLYAKGEYNAFDVVIPVHHKSSPLAYLLLGDLDENELKASPIIKHLPFIQTLVNIIVVAIENKRLMRDNIRQERVKKELELASEMQSMLFPSSLPNNSLMQIAAYYQPHQQVGGDYYDFIYLNEREVLFCLADVSGKGVSAALLMANFQANLRAMAQYQSSLTDMVIGLNEKVMDNAKGERFITLFIAKYNLETRQLNYINSAHPPPIMIDSNGPSELKVGCTGLGMFDEIPAIQEGTITIEDNALLCCFTDGVVELENADAQPFDERMLWTLLEENKTLSMQEMNLQIMDRLDHHRGDMPFVDDIALFSCRFF